MSATARDLRSHRIWWFALGYFLSYIPYSGLTRLLSKGQLPGISGPVSGLLILPCAVLGTVITMPLLITALGWWKHATRTHPARALSFRPKRETAISGMAFAVIIATTTLAYTFTGISIVLALVLMRGGTLILAPIVDALGGRKIHWYSWFGLTVSLAAVGVALSDAGNYQMTIPAVCNLAAYLAGYLIRFRYMTRHAKSATPRVTLSYFVEENFVAMLTLLVVTGALALFGVGDLRAGFTTFLLSPAAIPALLIGVTYGFLGVFGTLVFLDRRENTFAIPVNNCSSLLSGVVAAYAVMLLTGQKGASVAQLVAAGMIVVAMTGLMLPTLLRWGVRRRSVQRIFIFVCSGNTSRSPMAQAICRDEIAGYLNITPESLAECRIKVISAGLTARAGQPMTDEARTALEQVDVRPHAHRAQNITEEMVSRAEAVFCMTEKQEHVLRETFPEHSARIQRLDPQGDIEDPTGAGPEAFARVAERIRHTVRGRMGELAPAIPANIE